MGNEVVKYAPKAVIEELDSFNCQVTNGLRNVFNLFGSDDLLDTVGSFDANVVTEWVYRTDKVGACQMRELAVINHYLGIESLQPERETKYYVSSEDYDGETVVYFMTDLGIIDCAQYDTVIIYEAGFSKQLAEAIVAEVGGEIKEIK